MMDVVLQRMFKVVNPQTKGEYDPSVLAQTKYDVMLIKMISMLLLSTVLVMTAHGNVETVNGIMWTYEIVDSAACVGKATPYTPSTARAISESTSGAISIPSVLGGKPVTRIGNWAFYQCSGLTEVVIPPSVESIGAEAFGGCNGLVSITIPSSVANIWDCAFSGCCSLKSITIPETVKSIKRSTFYNCNDLAEITIPAGVTSMGDYAFFGCSSLMSIEIPPSVTNIGCCAFEGCSGLQELTIPSGVTCIESELFCDCSTLTKIVIPPSVTNIGRGAFKGCSGLQELTIPSGVTSIESESFCGCSALTKIAIPPSVARINSLAFCGCAGLSTITIPSSVASIDGSAFKNCSGIRSFVVDSENSSYRAIDGFLCTLDGKNLIAGINGDVIVPSGVSRICSYAFVGCSGLTSVVIPSSVTRIDGCPFNRSGVRSFIVDPQNRSFKAVDGLLCTRDGKNLIAGINGEVIIPSCVTDVCSGAFGGYDGLTSVVIQLSVGCIGERAFEECRELTMVMLSSSVTNIGARAFSGCSGLQSITIPSSVKYIDEYVFYGCSALKSILMHEGVTYLGSHAFYGCTGLRSMAIPSTVASIDSYAFGGCNGLTSIAISEGVLNVGRGVFDDCSSLTSVTIPSSVTNIDAACFSGCTSLTNMVLPFVGLTREYTVDRESTFNAIFGGATYVPSGLKSIEITDEVTVKKGAFSGCSWLASVVLPSCVTNIGSSAFKGCSGLTTITIPTNVTSIESEAFYGCSGLTQITIPSSVKNIGGSAFYGCSGLTTMLIPSGVTSINSAFWGCSGLTSVTISEGMESIGIRAFSGCSRLETISIPSSVTTIGVRAFENCSGLKMITIPSNVTSIDDYAFYGCSGLSLIVIPEGVESVGTGAFEDCSGLSTITLPSSLTKIGWAVFSGCGGLTTVTIPSGVTEIGSGAFRGCSGLMSIAIPPSVTYIGNYAFGDCDNLCEVHISDMAAWCKIDFINGDANPLCNAHNLYCDGIKLSDVVIPDGVTKLKPHVFYGFSSMKSVEIPASVKSIEMYAFDGCTGLTKLTIPSSVTSIEYNAFYRCSMLRSVTIPSCVTRLKEIISPMDSLERVVISEGVSSIDDRLFSGCIGLVSVSLPLSVTNISKSAFRDCSSLLRIYVPFGKEIDADVLPPSASIGWSISVMITGRSDEYTYDGMAKRYGAVLTPSINRYSVENVVCMTPYTPCDAGVYQLELSEEMFQNADDNYEVAFVIDERMHASDVRILPRDVILTSGTASKNCDGIALSCESVSVTGNGFVGDEGVLVNYTGKQVWPGTSDNSFEYTFKPGTTASNYNIKKVNGRLTVTATGVVAIASGVTELPTGALRNCSEVSEVRIPESVRRIGDDAFAGCTGLKKIVFPSRMELRWSELRRIGLTDEFVRKALVQGDWLVAGCVLLAYVGDSNVSELTVPDGIEIIEEEVFAGLYKLQKIHFCGTEREIGAFSFRDCTSLDDVVLPDSVEVIGEGAFSGCSYIFDFDMGNGVREIRKSAFEGCQTIENLVCSAYLLDVGDGAFADCGLCYIALPLGVTNVAATAFDGCSSLTSVTVPTHVAPLSQLFPQQYKSIRSVTIPDDETEMVDSMFEGCQSLGLDPVDDAESIVLPAGLTVIPDRAFVDCSSIVQLTLPTGIVKIGEAAFEHCQFAAFEMPDAVTAVGNGAFRDCSALRDVTLSKSLAAIPDELFAGCSSLDSFTVPGSVTQLGEKFVPYQTSAIYFIGNAPAYATTAYDSANAHVLINYVKHDTMGWNGQPTGIVLPRSEVWPANTTVAITYWEANQFDAVFDANGGYFENPESTTFACKETTFESYAIPPYDPIRPGYVFTGWWTDPMGGSRIRATTRVTLTKSNGEVQTIYAHWKKGDAKIVTIRFNAMGGTVNPPYTNCIAGTVYGNALKSVVPTKEYYDFYGWYTMAYWPDGELQTAESIVPDADRELFARWEAKTYVVRYHANGGTGTMEDGSFVYGDKFNLASNRFQRVGHVFAGWASTLDGEKKYNDRALLSDFGAIEDGVVDLYAVWVEVDCFYSIRYDSNGGVGYMTNQTVRIGDTVALDPNRFTREGYAFVGWALRADDYEKVYDDQERVCNLSEKDGDTVALFAVWVKAEGEVEVPVVSTANGTTFFGESGEVTITCATAGATIYYAIGASPRAADRYVYSGPFTISETSTVYAFAKKGDKKTDTVKVVITKRTLTLPEAIGAENLSVTTGGSTGWNAVVDDTAAKGVSARSGIMKAAEPGEWNESWMEIVVDGPGTLTFRWKVDCEWDESGDCTWDHLAYFIDNADTDLARIDGTTAWERRSVTFETPGPHSIRWVFAKDDYDDEFYGEDCGWIDEVTWTPLAQGVVVPAEITGGKELVVDKSWLMSLDAQFGTGTSAAFVEKFGSDLSAALLKSTGKKSAAGEDMYVWQDYVAGTDPTDPKSQFTAKIEMVDGEPVVIWSPKLNEAEAAKRVYTIYGKKTLGAAEPWTPVETPAQGGWRFFKVGVEMR